MDTPDSSFLRFLKGFIHAGRGVIIALQEQRNLKIHLLATIVVVGAGILFSVSPLEWGLLLLTIGLVWVSEMVNTSLEYLTDLVSQDYHPLAAKVKDVAAGAVLVASIIAVVVAIIIFGKYIVL